MHVAQERGSGSAGKSGEPGDGGAGNGSSRPRKALTIGAVAKVLSQEFEDISISKIRYLEDQKLLSPRRTQGGYRLYSQADVERLRTILRMQRDEFLPLRVIRQELATGDFTGRRPPTEGTQRRAASVEARLNLLSREDLIAEAGVEDGFVRELEEFGILQAERRGNRAAYDETDLEIVRAAAELSRFGVAGRNLRVFRTSADREAGLLEQLVGPALRSRSQARRKEAIENLESLAAICGHLKHLLLVRDLRRLKGDG
jgi:DNA-binding transcriptional MerR regulator